MCHMTGTSPRASKYDSTSQGLKIFRKMYFSDMDYRQTVSFVISYTIYHHNYFTILMLFYVL